MKALVTGAAGFVGRHMSRQLEARNWVVDGVDIVWDTPCEWVFHDDSTEYDLVVHAAAAGPNRKAIDTQLANFPYNVSLDAQFFEWAIRTQQRHVVYLSSSAVYSNHLRHPVLGGDVTAMKFPFTEDMGYLHDAFDTYGETKRFGEKMAEQARRAGVAVTVVRPFSGYGEDQSGDFPFRAFVERARHREDPFTIWGNANQVRDWVHIDDICEAIIALVENGVRGPVNICTGRGVSMRDLALLCHEAVGYAPHVDVDRNAPMGVMYRVGDPSLLNRHYVPRVSIEEGVRRALKEV